MNNNTSTRTTTISPKQVINMALITSNGIGHPERHPYDLGYMDDATYDLFMEVVSELVDSIWTDRAPTLEWENEIRILIEDVRLNR